MFDTNFWNSIIHGNTIIEGGQESRTCFGNIRDQANNIFGNTAGCLFGITKPDSVDPLLDSIDNNGGSTLTYALMSGSPAIDAGSPQFASPIDQRGFARPLDAPDIGAFEVTSGKINRVAHEADLVIDGGCPSNCSLRGAIESAFQGDTVLIPPGSYTVDTELVIDKDLNLTGYGENRTFIQAGSSQDIADHRVITIGVGVGSGETVNLSHLTVRWGRVDRERGRNIQLFNARPPPFYGSTQQGPPQ